MSDMKVLTEWLPIACDKKVIKENREKFGKIILKGVIQRANTLNQNGRVYPKSILEREIENYQKLIRENRALGECVDQETQIMTKRGWLSFNELEKDDKVFTLNVETGTLQEEEILHITKKHYKGKMLHFYNGKTLDMKLTPDHKTLIFDRNNNPIYMTAQSVYDLYKEESSWLSHCGLSFKSNWKGETPEVYNIPGTNIFVDPQVWAAFIGIYISEGCSDGVKRGYSTSNNIQITQKKKENIELIRELLKEFPLEWKERLRSDGETVDFSCSHKGLHDYLYELGSSSEKSIPSDILQWDQNCLEILLTWLLIGDGRNRVVRGKLVKEYYTTSTSLAQDVGEVFLKLGSGSNIRSYLQKDREIEPGRMILQENSKPMWLVSENFSKNIGLDLRFMKVDEVDHDDFVYCVTTPSGNWMAKRKGKQFWTGNCDHPDTSVVELKNASHIVKEAYMKGDDVFGTIEVLDTPSGKIIQSLIESGVTLGISSRGVGSTVNKGNTQVVQDDFQLICFDMVSEPSTPGAFMSLHEGKSIKPRDLNNFFNRTDRIDRIFNDILHWEKR